MKKIILLLLLVILVFSGLKTSTAAAPTIDYYTEECSKLEKEISELEKQLEELKQQINTRNLEYSRLTKDFNDKISVEDMYDWFNKCDIYSTRANIKITTKSYNTFLGIETSSSTATGSGVIIKSQANVEFVLTSYYVTKKDSDYKKVEYKIYDAFQNKTSASLEYESQAYGLSILTYTKTTTSDLYAIPLSNSIANVNDPVCTIYSLRDSAFNHMSFSTVSSVSINTTYTSFNLFSTETDTKSTIHGSMIVNLNGDLVGISLLTATSDNINLVYGVSVDKIKAFLNEGNITI